MPVKTNNGTKVPKIILDNFDDILDFGKKEPSAVLMEGIGEMSFDHMEPFPDHKFKLYEGQQLEDMVESIRQLGILLPVILWHTEDNKHIILSGHNRVNAGKLAGLTKAPIIIKEKLTLEEATLIVTETNLRQRSFTDLSYSERAYCLAQHYEAQKAQGRRSDLLEEIEMLINPCIYEENPTSVQVEQKLESRGKVGQEYGLSASNVGRYIKISTLISELLSKVDAGEIAFLTAYTLSFIEDKTLQKQIADIIERDSYRVDMKKAELLRSYYEKDKLNRDSIELIISGEKYKKLKSDKPHPMKVKAAIISRYFKPEQSVKEIESVIEKALEMYFEMQGLKEATG